MGAGACPAGAPQRRAATKTRSLAARVALDAEHPDPTPATRRAAAGLPGVSSSTWWAFEPCAEMQFDKWAAYRI
jgi:hypothetical protein